MHTVTTAPPTRRFAGRRRAPAEATETGGVESLAGVLLSDPSPAPCSEHASPPVPGGAGPLRGLYFLDARGIDPAVRRRTALAAAVGLAPKGRPAALLVMDGDRADVHLAGEMAWGRVGPHPWVGADPGRAVDGLLGQCDQVAVILLAPPEGGLRAADRTPRRVVFLATDEAESLVETYRGMKGWCAAAEALEPGLVVVGDAGEEQAARVHARLGRVARAFLGRELALCGTVPPPPEARAEPMALFERASSADVWPRLLGADRTASAPEPSAPAAPTPPTDPPPAPTSIFHLWRPPDEPSLVAAIEARVPALVGPRLRATIRIEVDEPGAPPLVAVCEDGALVAILVHRDGTPPETGPAEQWLKVHARLLRRAYPTAGIAPEVPPRAVVLAGVDVRTVRDGVRRFVPVRTGGRTGIVLLA